MLPLTERKGCFPKGNVPWNKGTVGAYSEEYKQKLRAASARKGKPSWNKGKPWSDESKEKMRIAKKGKKHSMEHNRNMGFAIRAAYRNGPEMKNKIREARAKQILPLQNTRIEILTEDWLKDNNIPYKNHKPFRVGETFHQVDFYVPHHDIVLECDGDYWHGLPKMKLRDAEVNRALTNQGLTVIRLSENEILSGRAFDYLRGVF